MTAPDRETLAAALRAVRADGAPVVGAEVAGVLADALLAGPLAPAETYCCCRPGPEGHDSGPCTWPDTDCYEHGPAAAPGPTYTSGGRWPSVWRETYYAGTSLPDTVAEEVSAQAWEHYTPHMLNVCGNTTIHNAARAAAEIAYSAGRADERAAVVAFLFAEARRHLDVVQPLKERDNFGAAEASRVSGTKAGTLARAVERGEHLDD